jgi:alkylhydroperoxidase family enzyme
MDLRRYELATLAAARRLRSSYCALAHGKVLAERFLPASQVRDAVDDPAGAGLDAVDIAVMRLADKVAADATSVGPDDIDELRALGLDDADVLDVILAAAARCFFSKVLDATGAEPDAAFRRLDPELVAALTVGRPIEAG